MLESKKIIHGLLLESQQTGKLKLESLRLDTQQKHWLSESGQQEQEYINYLCQLTEAEAEQEIADVAPIANLLKDFGANPEKYADKAHGKSFLQVFGDLKSKVATHGREFKQHPIKISAQGAKYLKDVLVSMYNKAVTDIGPWKAKIGLVIAMLTPIPIPGAGIPIFWLYHMFVKHILLKAAGKITSTFFPNKLEIN